MKRTLGILGGMGPAAGCLLLEKIIGSTSATTDQEHMPVVLLSDPRIPDRSRAILDGNDEPLSVLKAGVWRLSEMGVDGIVMPCNSAHYWYAELQKNSNVPILNMVGAVKRHVSKLDWRHYGGNQKIVVLGTEAVMVKDLYNLGSGTIRRGEIFAEIVRLTDRCIRRVKAGMMDNAVRDLLAVLRILEERYYRSVVLGCTELSVLIGSIPEADLPKLYYIDTLQVLATECIRWASQVGEVETEQKMNWKSVC